MSDDVIARLKNIEALVLSLKEDRAGHQPALENLSKALSPLVGAHADDLKHHLLLMLDVISKSEHADEGLEVQVGLISSQIESGFRNLAQNIASTVSTADLHCRETVQHEFEEQIELLKHNNAGFTSVLTRFADAQDKFEKDNREREIELVSQSKEIEQLKSALSLAQSQKSPEKGADDTKEAENAESLKLQLESQKAELVSKHQEEIRLFTAKYRALFEELATVKGNIRVVCRIRPAKDASAAEMIKLENPEQNFFVWAALRAVYQNDSKNQEARDFEFQRVFGGDETNHDVFNEVKDFAVSAAGGSVCTVMAYGATGSGKSHTFTNKDGLIQRYIQLLFELSEEERADYEYEFRISAVEIYLNRLYDLLQTPTNNAKAEIKLNGESTTKLDSQEAAVGLLERILERREVASTVQNATSSRSHFILTIKISKRSLTNSNETPIKGQVRFLDLAGSERVGKNSLTGGSGPQQTLISDQGNDINQSLLDLGKGIRSLATKDNFVPSHNLTRYIRSSLSPGSRLLIVATVSPLTANQNSTLNTLKWSQDAIGRPSQGKLVTQTKAPPVSPRTNKFPSAASSKNSTPSKKIAPPSPANTKR
ncbi:P-loop containing nucleoside triphosphate hydrolase protein [Xylaria scruposa]|nr:P-loop containing nucleoside triphosphate hydrolase protein [Xylaria scruposa]